MTTNTKPTVQTTPTNADILAELQRLRAENEALKARSVRSLSLKVSEKGAVSLYGLGRFPVTLYKSQWERLLGQAEEVKAFITANENKLATKPQT